MFSFSIHFFTAFHLTNISLHRMRFCKVWDSYQLWTVHYGFASLKKRLSQRSKIVHMFCYWEKKLTTTINFIYDYSLWLFFFCMINIRFVYHIHILLISICVLFISYSFSCSISIRFLTCFYCWCDITNEKKIKKSSKSVFALWINNKTRE